jgi:hypothetical protein
MTDPVSIAKEFFAALNEKRWGDAIDLISSDQIAQFEHSIHQLLSESTFDNPGAWYAVLFGFTHAENAAQLSGRDLMIAHARHSDPDAKFRQKSAKVNLLRTALGHVSEGEHLAHVVYRAAFYRGKEIVGDDALAVLTMELTQSGWRARFRDFSADLVFMQPSFSTGIGVYLLEEP